MRSNLWKLGHGTRTLGGRGSPLPLTLPLRPRLLFADFNENGFIDEEDLQRIILRLLNSDDVSEDLLTDLTSHVCALGCGTVAGVGPATTLAQSTITSHLIIV